MNMFSYYITTETWVEGRDNLGQGMDNKFLTPF